MEVSVSCYEDEPTWVVEKFPRYKGSWYQGSWEVPLHSCLSFCLRVHKETIIYTSKKIKQKIDEKCYTLNCYVEKLKLHKIIN